MGCNFFQGTFTYPDVGSSMGCREKSSSLLSFPGTAEGYLEHLLLLLVLWPWCLQGCFSHRFVSVVVVWVFLFGWFGFCCYLLFGFCCVPSLLLSPLSLHSCNFGLSQICFPRAVAEGLCFALQWFFWNQLELSAQNKILSLAKLRGRKNTMGLPHCMLKKLKL